jgi:hypothetical protein
VNARAVLRRLRICRPSAPRQPSNRLATQVRQAGKQSGVIGTDERDADHSPADTPLPIVDCGDHNASNRDIAAPISLKRMKLNRKLVIRRALAMRSVTCAAMVTAAMLAGCGGDDAVDPGPTAEGVYGGTLTNSASNAFNMLVLENGEYWSMYGMGTAGAFSVAGFVQGTGTSNNGSFSSSTAKDFGEAPAVAGTVSATYDATAKTIAGTVTSAAGSVTFSGGPIPGSLYVYNMPASLATISGLWSMTDLNGDAVTVTISSTGALAATNLACSFTGTVAPRATGKNVFNVALRFGPAPCDLAGQEATGIAVAYPLANGRTQLIVAAVDGSRTSGAAAVGVR